MANRRVFFAAHDCHSEAPNSPFQSLDPAQEGGRRGKTVIQHVALCVVELFFVWPSPEFVAHVEILNSYPVQRSMKRFPVKMGNVPRIWVRARIDKHLNFMSRQELNKHL